MSEAANQEINTDAYLVINAQVFPLRHVITRIGRKFDNDLVLQDANISRYHAEVVYEDGKFVLVDKQSSSGTFLNNQRIERAVLYSGDIISVANTPLMFMNESEAVQNRSEADTSTLG